MLRTIITVIAFLMLADGLFVLLNREMVEGWIQKFMPGLNVKKIAMAEVIFAALMLLSIYCRQLL